MLFRSGKKMQNLGYGKKMLSKLIEYLDKENINIVSLTVSPDNKKAIHIYEKYGFVKQELLKNEYGNNIDRISMQLKIKK